MAFLLVTLAFFIAGTVWVTRGAVIRSQPLGRSVSEGRKTDKVLARLASLVATSRQFECSAFPPSSGSWGPAQDTLDFLADLDGDPSTGSYSVGEYKGLERVVVLSEGGSLVARVYSGLPGESPRRVEMATDFTGGDASSFSARFRALEGSSNGEARSSPREATRVLLSITSGNGGDRVTLRREALLPNTPKLVLSTGEPHP